MRFYFFMSAHRQGDSNELATFLGIDTFGWFGNSLICIFHVCKDTYKIKNRELKTKNRQYNPCINMLYRLIFYHLQRTESV